MKPQSVKLGPVVSIAGVRVPVHRALRSLCCAECGTQIAVGEVFTRWPLPGAEHLFAMPKGECCAPFAFTAETSPLLQALFTQQQAAAKPPSHDISDETRQAFQARLGPALARIRRKH